MNLAAFCPPHRVLARYLEAARPPGAQKGWETRRENDDFTKQNIPEEYHLIWEKKKRFFKGDPHSRYEQFMEWLQENPEQNIYVQMDDADKYLKEREKEEKKETQCRKRCPSCYQEDDGSDVPF
jgi:hypothetical protein